MTDRSVLGARADVAWNAIQADMPALGSCWASSCPRPPSIPDSDASWCSIQAFCCYSQQFSLILPALVERLEAAARWSGAVETGQTVQVMNAVDHKEKYPCLKTSCWWNSRKMRQRLARHDDRRSNPDRSEPHPKPRPPIRLRGVELV